MVQVEIQRWYLLKIHLTTEVGTWWADKTLFNTAMNFEEVSQMARELPYRVQKFDSIRTRTSAKGG